MCMSDVMDAETEASMTYGTEEQKDKPNPKDKILEYLVNSLQEAQDMYYKFERREVNLQDTRTIILQSLQNGVMMMRSFSNQGSSLYAKAEK